MLDRFLRYVQIDTQSDPDSEHVPEHGEAARPRRAAGARAARARARGRGADRARLCLRDACPGRAGPTVGLIAHMDTSAGRVGHERQATGRAQLRRRRHRPAGRPAQGAPRRRRTRCSPSASGTTSSRPTARRCSAPTTRPASPRSWARSRTSCAIPRSSTRRSASASRSTRRSGAASTTSTSSAFGADFAYTLDGAELGRDRRRDVLRVRGADQDRGPQRPSRARRRGRWSTRSSSRARLVERLPSDERSPETTEDREGFVHPHRIAGTTRGGGAAFHRPRLRRARSSPSTSSSCGDWRTSSREEEPRAQRDRRRRRRAIAT